MDSKKKDGCIDAQIKSLLKDLYIETLIRITKKKP